MTLNRFTPAIALALATLIPASGRIGAAKAQAATPAQAGSTCALLTPNEVEALVPQDPEHVVNIVPAGASLDGHSCRYTWGQGTGRYSFSVSDNLACPAR